MIEWTEHLSRFRVTGNAILDVDYDTLKIGKNCQIKVENKLVIGKDTVIGDDCIINGVNISVGNNFYLVGKSIIGGGSCFDPSSKLTIGNHFHLGYYGMVNTAREVKIGNEVGLGMGTKVFTHGAYLSELDGFPVSFAPVTIEDRVWCPGAIINPGVTIGHDSVIGVGSVVNRNIPSHSLAVGIPARVIKSNYPPPPSIEEKKQIVDNIMAEIYAILDCKGVVTPKLYTLELSRWSFSLETDSLFLDFVSKVVTSKNKQYTVEDKTILNQFRRHGIRFEKEK